MLIAGLYRRGQLKTYIATISTTAGCAAKVDSATQCTAADGGEQRGGIATAATTATDALQKSTG